MNLTRCSSCALLVCACSLAYSSQFLFAQQTPPPTSAATVQPVPSTTKPSDTLRPALSQISRTCAGLNISRWKAPSEVRADAQQNVDSIERDLNSTLPGLLSQADAAPNSVAAVFPVYSNVDALYDVLLRVSETANLAAPPSDASDLEVALRTLESARSQLGSTIVSSAKSNEDELLRLQTAIQKAAAAQAAAPPPKTTVVDDGPAKTATPAKRKKTTTQQPATNSMQSPH